MRGYSFFAAIVMPVLFLFVEKTNQKENLLHAPMQKKCVLVELSCGTRFAQTVLAPPLVPFSFVAFLCCISAIAAASPPTPLLKERGEFSNVKSAEGAKEFRQGCEPL